VSSSSGVESSLEARNLCPDGRHGKRSNRCVSIRPSITSCQLTLQTPQIYGTEHDTYPLDVAALKAPLPSPANLALPEPNIFIPSSLELVTKEPVNEVSLLPSLSLRANAHFLLVSALHAPDSTSKDLLVQALVQSG
jgi:hypothetical protein